MKGWGAEIKENVCRVQMELCMMFRIEAKQDGEGRILHGGEIEQFKKNGRGIVPVEDSKELNCYRKRFTNGEERSRIEILG